MSTPQGYNELWKNVTWVNNDEKRAFFNKYFKGKEFVAEEISKAIQLLKDDMVRYIENTKEIMEGKTKRPITIEDIKKYIKGATID